MIINIKGYNVIIDDEDYEKIMEHFWCLGNKKDILEGHIYFQSAIIKNNKPSIMSLHRFLMNVIDNTDVLVDHKDTNTLNNKKENLRICNYTQNCCNAKKAKNNTSGYKGVTFAKDRNKWRSYISINHKKINLGQFNTPEEAYNVYCEASKKYHGEFSRIK